MTLYELFGTIEIGLVFAIVALGAYLSFQILDFPDLTVEGSFPLGAAVAAVLNCRLRFKSLARNGTRNHRRILCRPRDRISQRPVRNPSHPSWNSCVNRALFDQSQNNGRSE